MQRTILVARSDAVDQVMPMTGGRTPAFALPALPGGAHIRVYDSPARETVYSCHYPPFRPGDFTVCRAEGADGAVQIAAAEGGRLQEAASVYVVTRGRSAMVEATVEVYGEEAEGHV